MFIKGVGQCTTGIVYLVSFKAWQGNYWALMSNLLFFIVSCDGDMIVMISLGSHLNVRGRNLFASRSFRVYYINTVRTTRLKSGIRSTWFGDGVYVSCPL